MTLISSSFPVKLAAQTSQVDDDVATRLRAADEEVAVRRLIEWLGFVDDRARHQACLTGVTHTCPARPPDGDVARFGQLQDALVRRCVPVRSDAAARERYQ